jgi:hypothetical protein
MIAFYYDISYQQPSFEDIYYHLVLNSSVLFPLFCAISCYKITFPKNVFEPPYSPVFLGGLALLIVGGGSGAMIFGFAHQQYKQGYWK